MSHKQHQSRKGEQGNVLFLILIAVALFAALSYAVTQSSRSGGGDASSETNLVNSAQITQYPSSVRTAIIRMMVSKGVDVTDLEFDAPSDFGASSATNGVFHPSAGGASFQNGPAEIMADSNQAPWLFNSSYQIDGIGTTAADNSGNDIVAFLPGVAPSVCKKINSQLGITNNTDANTNSVPSAGVVVAKKPTAAMNMVAGSHIGAYDAGKVIGGDFKGQPFGCADFDDANAPGTPDMDLVYYHVLVER